MLGCASARVIQPRASGKESTLAALGLGRVQNASRVELRCALHFGGKLLARSRINGMKS